MTYPEKLAKRALINKCPKELLDNETLRVAVLKVMIELAQEAMQAQREADIEAIMSLKKVHGAMFFIEEPEHLRGTLEAFKQAILNAEVKL